MISPTEDTDIDTHSSEIGQSRRANEQGAVLVMALVFVVAVGLVVLAIANLASASLLNTSNLRAQRATEANAENAAMISAQLVRTSFSLPVGTVTTCPGSGAVSSEVVKCLLTSWSSGATATRAVQIFVCSASEAANCNSPTSQPVVLFAVISYGDVPANNPGLYDCSTSGQSTCGITMTINQWDVRPADN
jgi:hypothetical protein